MKHHRNAYGFIYKTILPDGRYYIGQHKIISRRTLDPTYFGSGVIIKDYIKSKGITGLRREIICFGNNHDEMNRLEKKYITEDILNDPKCINLDYGGRNGDNRTDDVKMRIGKAISLMREQESHRWENVAKKGSKNNLARKYKFTSPIGEEFVVHGKFKQFCIEHSISPGTMQKALAEGWIPKRGMCSGWLVEDLDTGRKTSRDTLNHGKPHSGMNNPWYKAKYKNI